MVKGAEMTNERDVWVLIEQEEGRIAEISLELLAKGHELAQTLGSRVCAVLCGHQLDGLAEKVIELYPELSPSKAAGSKAAGGNTEEKLLETVTW